MVVETTSILDILPQSREAPQLVAKLVSLQPEEPADYVEEEKGGKQEQRTIKCKLNIIIFQLNFQKGWGLHSERARIVRGA